VREWTRDLWSHLSELSTSDKTEEAADPAVQLMGQYIEWAAKNYAGEEVPAAVDLATCYLDDGEFLIRREELEENANPSVKLPPSEEWERLCVEYECLFWNNEYACITDGYHHLMQFKGSNT